MRGEDGGRGRDELRRVAREVEPHAEPAVVLLLAACRRPAAVWAAWTRSRRATPGQRRERVERGAVRLPVGAQLERRLVAERPHQPLRRVEREQLARDP